MKYAAFVPAGPNTNPDFVLDTLQSARHYIDSEMPLFVGDDSGTGKFKFIEDRLPNTKVLSTDRLERGANRYSVAGIFFLKKARLFREVARQFEFDRLLNLDDDALVIGPGLVDTAERIFATRERAGILGRYVLTHDFQPTPYSSQLERIYQQISRNPFRARGTIQLSIQPKLRKAIRPMFDEAVAKGYVLGTSFIGGSWIIDRKCLEEIVKRPEIDADIIKHSPNFDDDLFTAICYAVGYRVYDLLADPQVFHIEWRKLTMSPEELAASNVCVIHSVRDDRFGGEPVIREFFRQRRGQLPNEPQ